MMRYIVEALEPSDAAVCTNYVTEEYRSLVGTAVNTLGLSGSIYGGIRNADEGFKVCTEDGTIVAFAAFDYHGTELMMVSYFIAKKFRRTKAFYLLSKTLLPFIVVSTKVTYIPLSGNMSIPGSVCYDNKIHIAKYTKAFELLEKRWGDGKQ